MPAGGTTDPPPVTTPPPSPVTKESFPGYGQTSDLGSNWRIKFADADGIPLNMLSFDAIDFGAIAYKEIFQNVKTILATPLYSAALERLLGVDETIVDLPIDQAALATVAILNALYFWEPRAQALDVTFASDVISAHLICSLKLSISNVIFGTLTPYDRNNIFETPDRITQELPQLPMEIVEGPPGPQGPAGPAGSSGPAGPRGSLWFTGPNNPTLVAGAQSQDMYLNTSTGNVFQYDGSKWRQLK